MIVLNNNDIRKQSKLQYNPPILLNLSEKVYGFYKKEALHALKSIIKNKIIDLDATIEVEIENDWVKISIEGEDARACANFLRPWSLISPHEGAICKGKLIQVCKVGFGIFVDIRAKKDVLIPLFALRRDLCGNKKYSTKKIAKIFGFMDNLPLEIKITKMMESEKMEGELSQSQLSKYKKWIKQGYERIFATGATRRMIKNAIVSSGHLRDIIAIERLGLLESCIVLKQSTEAPGIIYTIGKKLKGVKLTAFQPKLMLNTF